MFRSTLERPFMPAPAPDSDASPPGPVRFAFEWQPGRGIPWSELEFEQTLGGGPGGQHVNRTASRVTLIWVPEQSEHISDEEKLRLAERLKTRISQKGELRIRSGQHRSMSKNKKECLELLSQLLRESLHRPRRRKPTKVPKSAHRKRLDAKNQRGQIKKQRRRPNRDD